jgi:Aldo/keto reductase family
MSMILLEPAYKILHTTVKFKRRTISVSRTLREWRLSLLARREADQADATDGAVVRSKYHKVMHEGSGSLRIRAMMLDARSYRGAIMIETSDFRTSRIPLNHGAGHMPALWFDTLIPDAAATISAARDALESGFRHFDCAERYRNEHEVGDALQAGLAAGGIAREDIFVTTKLSNGGSVTW